MKNLTKEQIDEASEELKAYFNLCPNNVKQNLLQNLTGFYAGWLAKTAFDNDKIK